MSQWWLQWLWGVLNHPHNQKRSFWFNMLNFCVSSVWRLLWPKEKRNHWMKYPFRIYHFVDTLIQLDFMSFFWIAITDHWDHWFPCVQACSVALSCPTLCDPKDYGPPGSSVHGDFLGKDTEAGCHFLLQGIFPTQGSNAPLLCLLHFRQTLYHWATWGPLISLR